MPGPSDLIGRLSAAFGGLRQVQPQVGLLAPCTEQFGAAEIRAEEPAVTVHRDAICIPWSASDLWGVFTSDGGAIDGSIDYRGPEKIPKQTSANLAPIQNLSSFDGALIYGGYFNTHFGHFLIDVIPRLWAKSRFAGVKILYHAQQSPESLFQSPFIAAVFDALNLGIDDLIVLDRPTRIKTLIVPDTSLREHAFAHRIFSELCTEIGDRLIGDEASSASKIVYLSKSRLSLAINGFLDEPLIERTLHDRGVEIIHPEQLTLQDHVKLFSEDRVVIGATGSALHASMFARSARIIGLNRNNVLTSTYRLLDDLRGFRTRYVYAKGSTSMEPDGRFHIPISIPEPARVANELYELALNWA